MPFVKAEQYAQRLLLVFTVTVYESFLRLGEAALYIKGLF